MKKIDFTQDVCECCGQSKIYTVTLARGCFDTLKAIASAIKNKKINIIHPRKELEGKTLTSNQVGNLSILRFHGLIASVKGNPGNYCITKKGMSFLKGRAVPKYAIVSKVDKKQVGYFEKDLLKVSISDLLHEKEYWKGIGFDIKEGRVIRSI